MAQAQNQPTAEQAFRSALADVIKIGDAFVDTCGSVAELLQICQLAIDNDGQLKLVMKTVTEKK